MGHFIGFLFEILVLASCVAAVITNSLLLASCDILYLSSGFRVVGSLGLYQANFPDGTDLDNASGNSGECVVLDDVPGISEYKDTAFNCARVCAVIAFFCGLVLLVFGFFKQCLCPLPWSQLLMDLSGFSIQIMLALVDVIWMSKACDNYQCTWGQGGTYLVLTQIFWLGAGCFTRCMRPGRYERRDEIKAEKAAKKEKQEREKQQKELEEEKEKNAALQAENDQLQEQHA
ncbi:MAG: hypothetical protein SGARI_008207 [Bacillariaceae sp.]